MKVHRTDVFDHNIRRETVPELTDEQYYALLFDEVVDVAGVTGDYLISYNYAEAKE